MAKETLELVVLSAKPKSAQCRVLGGDQTLTLRSDRALNVVPGEIAKVLPKESGEHGGRPFVRGAVKSTRIDAAALGLTPLRLEQWGDWNPREGYWEEEDAPLEPWMRLIVNRGTRPQYEMEQVLPGEDLDDPTSDPIIEANERREGGDRSGALKVLMELCETDLRCLDAHAHLGNLAFSRRPADAIRHFEVGLRIGELSLGSGFDGLLPWGLIDNRPFLRCLHGYGLCLSRLGRIGEANRVFGRMLWLNPTDNQGVRFLAEEIRREMKLQSRH